jgi:hypothetical protein
MNSGYAAALARKGRHDSKVSTQAMEGCCMAKGFLGFKARA